MQSALLRGFLDHKRSHKTAGGASGDPWQHHIFNPSFGMFWFYQCMGAGVQGVQLTPSIWTFNSDKCGPSALNSPMCTTAGKIRRLAFSLMAWDQTETTETFLCAFLSSAHSTLHNHPGPIVISSLHHLVVFYIHSLFDTLKVRHRMRQSPRLANEHDLFKWQFLDILHILSTDLLQKPRRLESKSSITSPHKSCCWPGSGTTWILWSIVDCRPLRKLKPWRFQETVFHRCSNHSFTCLTRVKKTLWHSERVSLACLCAVLRARLWQSMPALLKRW